ncbi:TonB-dependent receptor plug domain-containing protein [Marinigracilibium pacificum]|uniref:TonB-dependent receptor n=1 Tax=Marinigracilibium pacificum TaxID=2729599 RepID=A0A848J048_9BACT|nr:TonB-dependent receptor [Marinigracilibium pacificum]NMM47920.1 TonB-dependent receptor [Marinigracilibium pacificum]
MTKLTLPKAIMVGLMLLIANIAHSQNESEIDQDDLLQMSIEELMNIEINVGSNVVTDIHKQPVSVTTIKRDELLMSGGRTLSEAIMYFVPGFFAVEDQDDLIAGFRGMAPDNNSKVMLLLNGEIMNTEFFWGPAQALLNSTNYEYIERIEVIRGPGSVTLGQGALLGIINIVTKENLAEDGALVSVTGAYGTDKFFQGAADVMFKDDELEGYFHLSRNQYEGQELRNEGWVSQQGNQGVEGGTVFDMGHRLGRANNLTSIAQIGYKGFNLKFVHADQTRDLYNFYRDREQVQQILTSFSTEYIHDFNSNTKLKVSGSFAEDQFALYSLSGTTMGGTSEDRYGLKAIMNMNELFAGNKLAVGFEFRRFEMGKTNKYNNNYIANVVGTFDPTTANSQLTMGFNKDINIYSLFIEDFYAVNDNIDVFAAFRYDNHPFWGSNISPRAGVLAKVNDDLRFRFSYQSGFRGAVGLHYTGGYRRDGHLAAENFNKVSEANIPNEEDIPQIKPEHMDNFELATNYSINEKLNLEVTAFYSIVSNVIDVGVIYADPNVFTMPNIGTDIPGDWNGYWYFKNTPGDFGQYGLESVLSYKTETFSATVSHALVKVAKVTDEQQQLAEDQASMYLAYDAEKDNIHFKAYPENVFRANIMYKPLDKLQLSTNALYYSAWYSPIGTQSPAGFVLNLGASYNITDNISVMANAKNILNETALYPMNSNAGGADVSPGTPAWENPSFWATVRIQLGK